LSVFTLSALALPFHDGAPVISSTEAKTIANSYIVSFKPGVSQQDIRAHHNYVFMNLLDVTNSSSYSIVNHYYDSDLIRGYSGKFEPHVLEQIKQSPLVTLFCSVVVDENLHSWSRSTTLKRTK
jgi:hypothetical protein